MHSDNFEANEALSDIFHAKRLRGGEFRRYRLNVASGALPYDTMSPTNSEFPTFNQTVACSKHDVTYSTCSVGNGYDSFFNAIQRVTTSPTSSTASGTTRCCWRPPRPRS